MSLIGLPSLPKLSGRGIVNSILAYGQTQLWNWLSLNPSWGIYEAGSSTSEAVSVDSVIEVTVSEEADVPDYRIQTGSFASYNKVTGPVEIPLRITKSGSDTERQAFINWLQTAVRSPTVYDVMTRETVYQNVTLKEYSYERTAENGIDRIVAECHFVEIREAPEQYYDASQGIADTSNSSNADGMPIQMEKKVQTTDAGTTGSGIQDIFSMNRINTTARNALTSITASASSIVNSISKTASSYWDKVKGWF